MLGWRLFTHSVQMVTRNLLPAMQIFVLPWSLFAVAVVAVSLATGQSGLMTEYVGTEPGDDLTDPGEAAGLAFASVILAVGNVLVGSWTASEWHRFVLQERYPSGWMPPFDANRVVQYVIRSIVIGVLGAVAILIVTGAALILAQAMPGFVGGFAIAAGIAGTIWVLIKMLSAAMSLPSVAIGAPIGLGAAMQATRGDGGALIVLALSLVGFYALLFLVIGAFAVIFPPFAAIVQLPLTLFITVLNISVLTTLFGYFVEKRPLA
jgi:hypothetical protein